MSDSSMMVCAKCGECLPAESFQWHRKGIGKRKSKCKKCTSDYHRAYYATNRDAYLARSRVRNRTERDKVRRLVAEMKARPCMDCGGSFPWYVMEFDHRNPATKIDSIGNMKGGSYGTPAFLREVAKCDLVCANCHRTRTYRRGVRPDRVLRGSVPESSPATPSRRRKSNGQRENRTPDTRIFSVGVDAAASPETPRSPPFSRQHE